MSNSYTMEAILKKQLEEQEDQEIGIIISVFDSIVVAVGLLNVMYGEKVLINSELIGLVIHLEEDQVKILVLDDYVNIKEGFLVYRTHKLFSISLPEDSLSLLGRSWSTLELIKKSYDNEASREWVVDKPASGFTERSPLNQSIETGIVSVDSMMCIGRGQRQLILGNINTGKTSIILDIIINQKFNSKKIYCIYVGIGQKASSVKKVEEVFNRFDLFPYSMIIEASASDCPGLLYLTPYVAMAVGESLQEKGFDVLIFFDDLTKHAVAYRSIQLCLGNIPGREAYSGDIFFVHARLLERCGKFINGGSITGIPVVSTHDLTDYISTNIISITDGQLYLDKELFNKGQKPAINIGISVSRLGSSVQGNFMKKVCKSLKIDLSAAEELAHFTQLLSDLEGDTKKIIDKGNNIKKILKQENYKPYKLWQEIVLLFAVLEELKTNFVIEDFYKIFEKIEKNHSHIIKNINQDKEEEATLKELRDIILCN